MHRLKKFQNSILHCLWFHILCHTRIQSSFEDEEDKTYKSKRGEHEEHRLLCMLVEKIKSNKQIRVDMFMLNTV